MKFKKIDWVNHSIAFVASVIGIFIAFQLDDWQDRKSQKQRLITTLRSIREEVEENIRIFKANDSMLTSFVGYVRFMESHGNRPGEIVATAIEIDSMIAAHPTRFGSIQKIGNAGLKNRYVVQMIVDVVPTSGISTSSWEAAKASGILTNLDHARMSALTRIYEWTSKTIGISDEEFMENFIGSDEYDDMTKIVSDYKILAQVIHLKLTHINEQYQRVNWELK